MSLYSSTTGPFIEFGIELKANTNKSVNSKSLSNVNNRNALVVQCLVYDTNEYLVYIVNQNVDYIEYRIKRQTQLTIISHSFESFLFVDVCFGYIYANRNFVFSDRLFYADWFLWYTGSNLLLGISVFELLKLFCWKLMPSWFLCGPRWIYDLKIIVFFTLKIQGIGECPQNWILLTSVNY